MEPYTNEQQAIVEKAIRKFLEENKELVLRRILALEGIDISASPDKDINLKTSGTGKALYNGVEIGAGGGGGGSGGTGYIDRIIGKDCPASVQQPMVICSPPGAPCEIHVIAGKNGRIVFKKSD